MSGQQTGEIGEAATLWAIRVHDSAFDDWDGLTAWLEQDPAHLATYEMAVADDIHMAAIFRTPPSHPIPESRPIYAEPPRRAWLRTAAAGVAATMVAALGTWAILGRDAPAQEIATAPGEHRTIDLADGSRIMLNGGTRVVIDADQPREVAITQGEALFQVRHDDRDPFVVTAGHTRLLDAGTVFNVVQDHGALDVAVAEGAVIYQPGPRAVRLDPGDALSLARPGAVPVIRKARAEGVGSWRDGRLEYANAPLDAIARDLGRNLGRPVSAAPGSERLRFTGVMAIDGPPDAVLTRIAPLLGVRFVRGPDGWLMTPEKSAPN